MTVLVNLQAGELHVEPGRAVSCPLDVTNTGTIVEQFTIMMLGDVAPWTEAAPPVVSLFPGGHQTVTLTFAPPRAYTTPSGVVPFAVKVIPSTEPEDSVTEEADIIVGSFTDVGAELVPRVATGRISGHQKLAVDSRGNVPLPVEVNAVDAADALKFQFRPAKLTTAPGEARFVRVRVKPRQRFWKGPPQHKPYKVQVAPADEQPLVLEGSLTQKSILPKWFLPFVGIAGALLLLWFLYLKPKIHNDAVNANKAALAVQAAQTKALANQVAAASQSANQANATAAAAAALAAHKPVTTTTSTTTTTTTLPKPVVKVPVVITTPSTSTTTTTVKRGTPPPVPGPNDNFLQVFVAPGASGSTSSTPMPPHTTLVITDIIIQNISGAGGLARIQRVPAAAGQPTTLLEVNLAPITTDQDIQFNTPIRFTPGQSVVLAVDCQAAQGACAVGMTYSGILTVPFASTTTTVP
jgi:hypothetical protein